MLRWAIQHQAIVIPKSTHKERISANGRVFDFALSDADMQTLDELDRTTHSSRARR
jgi:diketogulonate reductase-like aldo/keto reductase